MHQFLSFDEYMKTCRIKYNKKLFQEDPMYFAKIWKAQRVFYIDVCRTKKLFNEAYELDERLNSYEERVASARYAAGSISEAEYKEMIRVIDERRYRRY